MVDTTIDTAHQGYIEPQATLAQVDSNGMATVWAATQGQHTTEIMISRLLDRPQSRIKVVPVEIGGGFGGKISHPRRGRLRAPSEITGRPVKMVLTREEVFQGGSGPPAAARHRIEVAADADGTLTAIKGLYQQDCGGLPGLPPSLMMQASAALYQSAEPAPRRLRCHHQQAAHRSVSRPRRHSGVFRDGAGDGQPVPTS